MNILKDSFKKETSWEENHEMNTIIQAKVILDEVLDDIFKQIVENNEEKIKEHVTLVFNGKSMKAETIIDSDKRFASNFYKRLNGGFIIKPANNGFCQVKVHNQYVEEFAGYHMLYNTFQVVKFYRSGKSIYLKQLLSTPCQTNANFWKFKRMMSTSMMRWAKKFHSSEEEFWDKEHCLNGALNRQHIIILSTQANIIRNAFMTNPSMYFRTLRILQETHSEDVFALFSELIGKKLTERTLVQH